MVGMEIGKGIGAAFFLVFLLGLCFWGLWEVIDSEVKEDENE